MSAESTSYPGDLWVGTAVAIASCCASQVSTEDPVVASAPTAKVGAVVNTGVVTVVPATESTVMVWETEFVLLPSALVAVRVTVYDPAVVYTCDGFWALPVLPSPKDQSHDVGEPVDSSVNWTVRGAVPEVRDSVNAATGVVPPTTMYPVMVVVFSPCEFSSVNDTVYVPLFTYVLVGFSRVLVLPSPKLQLHDAGEPVDSSVNVTSSGAVPDVGEA
jgi:hypothetical protein